MQITNEIRKEIEKLVYERDGQKFISIGNCRLDFSKEYIFLGFTKKTVKLAYMNGREQIKVQGRLELRNDYIAFYTEGWSFIERIKVNSGVSA